MRKKLQYFKDIASEYVRQRIYAEEVDIQSVKLMDNQPVHVVVGKALKRSTDFSTSQCGVWEQCNFTLQIMDEDGNITGEEFGNWVSCEQNTRSSYASQGEIPSRNSINESGNDFSSLAKKYGIDPSRFRKR